MPYAEYLPERLYVTLNYEAHFLRGQRCLIRTTRVPVQSGAEAPRAVSQTTRNATVRSAATIAVRKAASGRRVANGAIRRTTARTLIAARLATPLSSSRIAIERTDSKSDSEYLHLITQPDFTVWTRVVCF
jgi:hypothetical protein